MNVLGTALAVTSFLNMNKKSPADNKIGQFYANMGRHSVARTNRFEVRIGMPNILSGYNGSEEERLLTLRCETAMIPGVSINTAEIQRYGYGLSEKVPVGATYGGFGCSFIGDSQGLIYKLFYRWMNGIVKFDEKPNAAGKTSYNKLRPYEFEYKTQYTSNINLLTYSENNDELMSCDIYEAFPINIGDIQYNWGDNDSLVRIPVQFAFSHSKISKIDEDAKFKAGDSNTLGLFGTLIKAGTAIQTIAALKKPQSVGDAINVVNNAKTVLSGFNL